MAFVETITSRSNPKIKEAAALLTPQGRKKSDCFLLEGVRLCSDAVYSGYVPEILFATKEASERYGDCFGLISTRAKQTYYINESVAEKLSDTEHNQQMFCVYKKLPQSSEPEIDPDGFYLMTDNLQNPDNLGAVVRSCEALGASGLIITSGCDMYTPKAMRASMGALLRFPVIKRESATETVKELKAMGMKIFGTVVSGNAEKINTVSKNGGCVCIIGNEGNGVSPETINLCDCLVTIPMKGRSESLNASAATAITVWEFMKDR